MLLRRFPIPPQHHWFPWAAQASTRRSRIPRLAGYGFMAAAALLAAVMKKEGAQTVGPLPAVAVALFLGMVGDDDMQPRPSFDERNLVLADASLNALTRLGVLTHLRQPPEPERRIQVSRAGDREST